MPRKEKRANRKADASMVEALQQLVADMSKASSIEEADEGLKRLKEIRGAYLSVPGGAPQTRKDAEALIAWVQSRLEQLREMLVKKRRIMEGEAAKKIAQEREAAAPSLLPTELIDAVVHFTDSKDPEELSSSAPQPAPVKPAEGEKRAGKPEKKEKTAEKEDASDETAKPEKAGRSSAWTRYEQLAAHMAASVRETPDFFEMLRNSNKRKGPRMKAPAEDAAAENYFRSVHDLNKRLVNLELHAKAMAAAKKEDRLSPLLRSAAREIRLFTKDLKAGKAAMPEMAPELDRLFGGWAECFAGMKPEKGGDILASCAAERGSEARQAAEKNINAEPQKEAERDAPVLVLKRNDWEQPK